MILLKSFQNTYMNIIAQQAILNAYIINNSSLYKIKFIQLTFRCYIATSSELDNVFHVAL